jgi:predicted outer membrane repeat protein
MHRNIAQSTQTSGRLTPLLGMTLLGLAACNGGGNTDPNAGTPEVVWTPEVLEFGQVALGEVAEQTFDITNAGAGMLEVYTIVVADGERDEWTLSWDRSTTPLGAGETTTVSVFFTPENEEQVRGGRIQVRTNDPETPSFFVLTTGSGAPSNADNDGDGVTVAGGDCNDDNPDVYPGAPELCNGVDDDCSGSPGADEVDGDGDGVRVCDGDCDDTNGDVYPGAPEICDGLDSDCDGTNQDNADVDADGLSVCDGDCNDNNPDVNPSGVEACGDGLDNDCDGTVDAIDADGDGHDVCSPTGDCDDNDALAYPLVVTEGGAAGALGTPDDPLGDLAEALGALDSVFRTVYLEAGTYGTSGVAWAADSVMVRGRGATRDDVVLDGGGARILDITGGTFTIDGVTLTGGTAPAGENGGAVRVANASFTAIDSVFRSNTTDALGGAIYGNTASVSFQQGCLFEQNSAADGGAVAVAGGTTLFDPNGSSFLDNTATNAGGALHIQGSTAILTGSFFEGNDATTGGAVAVDGGGGHLIQRGLYHANDATTAGAVWVSGTSDGVFRNNALRDNTGGAARLTGAATLTVVNNTFTSNIGTEDGVVLHVDTDNATVLGNIGHFNDGPSGLFAPAASLSVIEYNTVFATSSSTDFAGAVAVGVGDNTSENPGFVAFSDNGDPNDDDLALGAGSPAVDTGPPDPQYNDPDGTRNDRGSTGGPGGQ